ncbi:MAG: tetratricopeptide repeat protein, partial [Ottowia sp.]|nr:tetratricopeptide repeat protein [Ottowia sp.]
MEIDAGDWGRAAHYLEKAVKFAPTNRRAAFQYARALFMTGQTERAEEVFERALAGAPSHTVEQARRWRASWNKG